MKADEVANFITFSILNQLKLDKRVLFFVPGGRAIGIAVKVAEILRKKSPQNLIQNLTITLTDERYGPINHSDSNYFQLLEKGFSLPGAKIISVLNGEDRDITTKKFDEVLNHEFMVAEYKVGLFGVGSDGHTAGILPGSVAVESQDLACAYDTPTFSRITITPKAIEKLDEAVVWAQGEEKWGIIEGLKENIDIKKQPAQILKKVPSLTIFTDYQME